jgi:PKD repeat protein
MKRNVLLVSIVFIIAMLLIGTVGATVVRVNATVVASPYRTSLNDTVANIRLGAGTALSEDPSLFPVWLESNASAQKYNVLYRLGIIYPTGAAIPDDATIVNVTEYIFGEYKSFDLGVPDIAATGFVPATSNAIIASDYNKFGNTTYTNYMYGGDINGTDWNTWAYNAAGIANVSKTTNTTVMYRSRWDIDNSTSNLSWVASASAGSYFIGNSTFTPYLMVNYTTAGSSLGATNKSLAITNKTTMTNYQHKFNLTYQTGMNANFSDLRFFQSDNTECDYWIENKVDSAYANIWIEVPTASQTSLTMNYNNASAVSRSSGVDTFLLFDDFDGSSINTSKWIQTNTSGTISVSGGSVTLAGNLGSKKGLESVTKFATNTSFDVYVTGQGTASSGYLQYGYGWYADPGTFGAIIDASDSDTAFYGYAHNGATYQSLSTQRTSSTYSYIARTPTIWRESYNNSVPSDLSWTNDTLLNVTMGAWTTSNARTYSFQTAWVRSYNLTEPSLAINESAVAPTAAFTSNVTGGEPPFAVQFNDTSTGGTPTNWDWYWYANETKSSDDQNATATFTSEGTYNVRLYASNTIGGDWENKTAYITGSTATIVPVYISNPVSVTNYQHKMNLTYQAGMNVDFSDIRFYQTDGTPCDYWLENKVNSSYANVWIEIPSASQTSLNLSYGVPSRTSASNGDNTFLLFDDFDGAAINTSKWTDTKTGGTITVSGGKATLSGNLGAGKGLVSTSQFGQNTSLDYYLTGNTTSSGGMLGYGYGWYADPGVNYFGQIIDASNSNDKLIAYAYNGSTYTDVATTQSATSKRSSITRSNVYFGYSYDNSDPVYRDFGASNSINATVGMWAASNTLDYSFETFWARKYSSIEPVLSLSSTPAVSFYAYGDSITRATGSDSLAADGSSAYVVQMQQRYLPTATVGHNADGGSMTSSWGASNYATHKGTALANHYYFIMFGINDRAVSASYPANSTADNLISIYNSAKADGYKPYILLEPLDTDVGGWSTKAYQLDNITKIQTRLAELGYPYIKAYDALDAVEGNGQLDDINATTCDAIHPNVLGHSLMADYVWARINASPASFTVNTTSGAAPLAVKFNDTTVYNPNIWRWSVQNTTGNNTILQISTAQNFTTSLGAGTWKVYLNATSAGGSNTTTTTITVGGATSGAGVDYNITPYPPSLYVLYPADHIINAPIDTLPLRSDSAAVISQAASYCTVEGGNCRIWTTREHFINVVNSTLTPQYLTAITESPPNPRNDNIAYPIPPAPDIFDSGSESDMYILSFDNRKGYEFYNPLKAENGTWSAYAALQTDYSKYSLTDSDSYGGIGDSGIPQIPCIFTYDEAATGMINHSGLVHMYAARSGSYLWPALGSGSTAGTYVPQLGSRFRLKSSFDVSGYTPTAQVILNAWKKYGVMLSDENRDTSMWTFPFTNDDRWATHGVNASTFLNVRATDWELVDVSSIMISSDSGQVSGGGGGTGAPVASFTMNVSQVNSGNPILGVQFTDTSSNYPATRSWKMHNTDPYAINTTEETFSSATNPVYGFGIGNFSVTLTATNSYGSSSATKFVNVTGLLDRSPLPGNYRLYQSDNFWNVRKDSLPLDPKSSTYTAAYGTLTTGIGEVKMVNAVNGSFPKQRIAIVDLGEPDLIERSNLVPYPLPRNTRIEVESDHTIVIVDNETNWLYEIYDSDQYANGTYWAEGTWAFDLSSYELQPMYSAGSGAAGLPGMPGAIRYEEVETGFINHTLYLTLPTSRDTWRWPARGGGNDDDANLPPLGQVFKLKSSFDISGYNAHQQTILNALKQYGAILGDHNGRESGQLGLIATVDSRWTVGGYNEIGWDKFLGVHFSDFEAVDTSSLMLDADSWQVYTPGGAIPVANFTADNTNVAVGQQVHFTDTSTNTPTSWNWTFTTTQPTIYPNQNQVYVFSAPGDYSITLTAGNGYGTNTVTKTNYIHVSSTGSAPISYYVPSGTYNYTSSRFETHIELNQTLNFTTSYSTNPPAYYNWVYEYGNGTQFTSSNPNMSASYDYLNVTAYNTSLPVSLVVGNSYGNSIYTSHVIVSPPPVKPVPIFLMSSSYSDIMVSPGYANDRYANITPGVEPDNHIVLIAGNSLNNPTLWTWTIDAGNGSVYNIPKDSGAMWSFDYSTDAVPGYYPVTLTVSNSAGSGTITATNIVHIRDFTPPYSIRDLTGTAGILAITWKWTPQEWYDYTDDLDHVEIWKNGVMYENVTTYRLTNPNQWFGNTTTWHSLSPSTSYTISTRTVDTSGNTNMTWVNATLTTSGAIWNWSTPGTYSWTCPPDVTNVSVLLVGGGGSGKGGSNNGLSGLSRQHYSGGGGNPGTIQTYSKVAVVPGQAYVFTIGAGGADSPYGTPANDGTTTSSPFGSAPGGTGGISLSSNNGTAGQNGYGTDRLAYNGTDTTDCIGTMPTCSGGYWLQYYGGVSGLGNGASGGGAARDPDYEGTNATYTSMGGRGADGFAQVIVSGYQSGNIPDFSATPTTSSPGTLVHFKDLSIVPDTMGLEYNWSFGDYGGTTVPYSNTIGDVQHVYAYLGSYDVSLTITNTNGTAVEKKSTYINIINQESGKINTLYPREVSFTAVDRFGRALAGVPVTSTMLTSTVNNTNWLTTMFGLADSSMETEVLAGTTDDAGQVVFPMIASGHYRLVFTDSTRGISDTRDVHPSQLNYIYILSTSDTAIAENKADSINVTLGTYPPKDTNPTTVYLMANYTDLSATTTAATFYVLYPNQTPLYSEDLGAVTSANRSYAVANTAGSAYIWGINATTTKFGRTNKVMGITLPGTGENGMASNLLKVGCNNWGCT